MKREQAYVFYRGNDVHKRWLDPTFWRAVLATAGSKRTTPIVTYRRQGRTPA